MNDTEFCVNALAELFYSNLLATEDFGDHVRHCAITAQIIAKDALVKNLMQFDDDMKAQLPKTWKSPDKPERTIITLLGAITYKRRVYIDEYGSRRYPLDEALGIAPRQRIEPGAFLWIVRKAADVSFRKTARAFLDKTGLEITPQSVMRCVHKEGELLSASAGAGIDDSPFSVPALFCEYDGFYVNIQVGKKGPRLTRRTYKEQFRKKSIEMKVWVAYPGKKHGRRVRPLHWASKAAPDDFFKECIKRTSHQYELDGLDYLVTCSDAAGWCIEHGLDAAVCDSTVVISKLDTFHVNQKVLRAFSSEEDRSVYLDFLYKRDFTGFFEALEARQSAEPDDERAKKRQELHDYIANNLDWLEDGSLTRYLREQLLSELPAVFGERTFCGYLHELLNNRRYKRFVAVLEQIVSTCDSEYKNVYGSYLKDTRKVIAIIRKYAPVRLGSMEGTNAKVYAARLKVWGCAWSERGALAMMRIRAAIASNHELIAPAYDSWLTEKEKARIEVYNKRTVTVPKSIGSGYEPPQGSIPITTHMAPQMYGLLYC
jgi:hypothetical protein